MMVNMMMRMMLIENEDGVGEGDDDVFALMFC